MKRPGNTVRQRTPAISRTRRVQIVSCKGCSGLDIAAFVSVFEEANQQAGEALAYEIHTVRFEQQRPSASRESAGAKPLDILVVAAGVEHECNAFGREEANCFKRAVATSERVVALGGGTFLLAKMGLLQARKVVVHWTMQDRFQTRFPMLESDGQRLYAKDGRVYTCAGGVASIDCALALVEQDLGSRIAGEVAQVLLLPYRRGSDFAQMSSLLRLQTAIPDKFSQLIAWLPDHLQEDLSVKALARRSAMSTRNFARIFHKRLGVTPALYVENLRLQAAKRELHVSCASLPQIADVSGFSNPETLRRTFLKHMGITPGNYRRNGAAAAREQPSSTPIQAPTPGHPFDTRFPLPCPNHIQVDGRSSL